MQEIYDLMKRYSNVFMPDQEVIDFIEALRRGELVESIDVSLLQKSNIPVFWMYARMEIGFVSPTLEWARTIKELVGDGRVLEIGAGTGLVAKYLDAVGVDIVATDDMSWQHTDERDWKLFFNVECLDLMEAIFWNRSCEYLLMCWPMDDDPFARVAAKLYNKLNPDGLIIYIGEWRGCTADDEFHDGVEIVKYMDNSLFPQWKGWNDKVMLVRWKCTQ